MKTYLSEGSVFKLTENFVEQFRGKQPKWGPLGYLVYSRSYARALENGGHEEYWQTCRRVVEGVFTVQLRHCKAYGLPWNGRKAQNSAQEMFERMWQFKFTPPGRGLWAMGTDFVFEKGSACLFNCAFRSTKDIDINFSAPFVWIFDMSMMGVGCGFDTEGSKREVFLRLPRKTSESHVVEDSREGWVEITRRVLDAYVGKDTLPEKIDFSQIRPAGSIIKGFGGTCPGSKPLEELIEKLQFHLNNYVREDKAVDATLIVDITNLIGAAVVAGGIRRTALIALGDFNDVEFRKLKDPVNLDNPMLARWSSNNTLKASLGDNYNEPAAQTAVNGEPGYYWLDNARRFGRMIDPANDADFRVSGINPCGEICLEDAETCNISETFPSIHDGLEDYLRTLKYAYMYCKTVTLIPTHSEITNQVQMRNRRLGISQSGIIENINRIGFREHIRWCDEGYKELKKLDRIYSEWLCVPTSRKLTTVKPSGSVSLLPQVTPGIHFPHSQYYIRRVRLSKDSSITQAMIDAGYKVEPDVMQPDYTSVVEIPVQEKHFSARKKDVSMWQQLELAAQMQAYWSDNAVSITVTIKPEEAKDLAKALEMYESRLKAISFLPLEDHNYAQAPYEEIDEAKFKEMTKGLKKPKLNKIAFETEVERFCDGETCYLGGKPEDNK